MNEQLLFNLVDLAGTFAFAISGATAARRCNLDLFGILAIAFITACGGGWGREGCRGAHPAGGECAVGALFTAGALGGYREGRRL